jgi:hypothetical protein
VRQRRPRIKNEAHLKFIRRLPCLICLGDGVDAAHLRMADLRADKRTCGMAEKPDDCWTLPLCRTHHDAQHKVGERKFWDFGIFDPTFICLALWRVSGDDEAGDAIIRAAQ